MFPVCLYLASTVQYLERSLLLVTAASYQWFAAQRYYVHKTCFRENCRYKGRMSSYVDIRHLCFMTPARTTTIIDKNHDICNDVNKTSTSVELLAIHVIRYISKRSNVGLSQQPDLKSSLKSGTDKTSLRIHWSLMNCFNKVISLRFYKEPKFQLGQKCQNLNFVKKWT